MRFKIGFIVALVTLSTACINRRLPEATVMITNLSETSGGSGSIVRSTALFSEILTNAHVCGVVKAGGLVHTLDGKKHPVVSYKLSERHDLCLIRVAEDLGTSVRLSTFPPVMFETANVSGHPHLLPTVISPGHFSGKAVIRVMTGVQECTKEDMKDPNKIMICIFMGGIPIIKAYEAILVTATIQPGSSGSAVFGSADQIGAVIFAGSGDFGYGFAVPYEYVHQFLYGEAFNVRTTYPSTESRLPGNEHSTEVNWLKKLKEFCSNIKNTDQKRICDDYELESIMNDVIQY